MSTTSSNVIVRLSAEGAQRVLDALRRIQAAAQSSTQSAGNSAAQMASNFDSAVASVTGLASAIKGLAVVAAITAAASAVADMVTQYTDAAAALTKLSIQTGISVEELSRLKYAVEASGATMDEFSDFTTQLAVKMDEASTGSGDAADAFKALGIKVKDSSGALRPMGDVLDELADKFAAHADGAAKTAMADKLFSDAGVALIPVLNQGSAGLKKLKEDSDKLGKTMSKDAVSAAAQFEKSLHQLKVMSSSLSSELIENSLPTLNKVVTGLTEVATRMFKAWEGGAGIVDTVGAAFDGLGKRTDMGRASKDMLDASTRLAAAQKNLADFEKTPKGDLYSKDGGKAAKEELLGKVNAALADYRTAQANATRIQAELDKNNKKKDDGKKKQMPLVPAEPAFTKEALSAAKEKALISASENELRRLQSDNSQKAAEDKAALDKRLITLEEYHDKRIAAINEEIEKEKKIYEQKLSAANALPSKNALEKTTKAESIATATTELDLKKAEATKRLAEAEKTKEAELKKLNDERISTDIKLLELTGAKKEAAIAALDAEIAKLRELMQASGYGQPAIEAVAGKISENSRAKIDFEAQAEKANQVLAQLDYARTEIDNNVGAGLMSDIRAKAEINKLEQERLDGLIETSKELKRIADLSGDDSLKDQAKAVAVSVAEMQNRTSTWENDLQRLTAVADEAAAAGLNTFFDSMLSGSKSASDAFKELAVGVIDSIRRMATEMLVQQLFTKSGLGGGGGFASGLMSVLGFSTGGLVQKFSTGGYIRGPGTGTSDSIPALVSNGEFVMREAVVRQPGMLALLEEMNSIGPAAINSRRVGGVARFADGGLVGTIAESAAASTSNVNIGLSLDPGLVLEQLRSPAGAKVMLEQQAKNRRAFSQVR